jgi:hypothetical protein
METGTMTIQDALRGTVTSVAAVVGYNGTVGVIAQALPGVSDSIVMQMAEKGGGWVVLMVVLWVYRRDYKRLSEGETARVNQLIALHEKTAQATQDVAVALSRNTEVVRMIAAQVHGHDYQTTEYRREDFKP